MEQFIIPTEIKEMAANMRRDIELFFPYVIRSAQEKNFWIAQVLTIASVIIGAGFLLFQQQGNLVIHLGIGLLFVMILVGLVLVYRGDKDFGNRIMEAYGKMIDYHLRAMEYYSLLVKQNLTEADKKRKQGLENYFSEFFEEFGIITKDGTLGGVEKKLKELLENNKKSDVGVYFLIFGFLVGGILLIVGNYISKY